MRLWSLSSRRCRTRRLKRFIFIFIFVFILLLTFWLSTFEVTVSHKNAVGGPSANFPSSDRPNRSGGAGENGDAQALPEKSIEVPYGESLEELLQLLRVYAAYRGVRVNHTYLAPTKATAAADAGYKVDNSTRESKGRGLSLELSGMELLHGLLGDHDHLWANWSLEAPEKIMDEHEVYVEQFIAPTRVDDEITPLRVISSHYSTQSIQGGLDGIAANTEKAMNDDGYAEHTQRSPGFFDVSHAARRGYGQEGSIFVAVPFSLADITAEMIDTIRQRSTTSGNVSQAPKATATERPPNADDFVGDDGFTEWRFTAARCAMTVSSLFSQAHRGVAVTVGTIDVVVVSGVASLREVEWDRPADALFPLRATERSSLTPSRHRRYSRITCEPPEFAGGLGDASEGFHWKDNLRRRRVVVPLPRLESASPAAAAALEQSFAFPYVGRYAALRLYRGESYIFFLRTGALALPNWDLMLRLLYLRTPARNRGVLTSRPTPGVVWRALAAALAKTWITEPLLPLSLTTAVRGRGGEGKVGAPATTPDEAGNRLLAALPAEVSSWLSAARVEAELVLWLVTPGWLWPTMLETLEDWRHLAAAPTSSPPATAPPALSSLFSRSAVRDLLGEKPTAPPDVDVGTLRVDHVMGAHGGAAAAASRKGQPVVQVRGGKGAATGGVSQSFLSASLTASEVYESVFLPTSGRSTPSYPTVDMAHAASTRSAAPSRGFDGAAKTLCGEQRSAAPYYSAADKMLLKRSFEYCWLMRHIQVVRQHVHRLLNATEATTLLRVFSGTQAAANFSTEVQFAESVLRPRSSSCLADMRYLEPVEGFGLAGIGRGAGKDDKNTLSDQHALDPQSTPRETDWLVSAVDVGKVHGVPTAERLKRTAGDDRLLRVNATQPTEDTLSSLTQPTPYIVQAAASADLLFGPAEAFFHFRPEHQLRTRARSLSEHLEDRRLYREKVSSTATHARVPEAVELDASLQFLDGDAEDIYMTQALWTRGWNLFGLTEPVAVNIGEDGLHTPSSTAPPPAGDGGQRRLRTSVRDVPSVLQKARAFTDHKLWALLMSHRNAGTVLGATEGSSETATPYSFRRTIKDWELFARVQLTILNETLRRWQ